MKKRSLTIAGHRTSIALEPQFWDAIERMAAEQGQSLSQFVAHIDESRQTSNLSSSLRLAVLDWYREKLDGAKAGSPKAAD